MKKERFWIKVFRSVILTSSTSLICFLSSNQFALANDPLSECNIYLKNLPKLQELSEKTTVLFRDKNAPNLSGSQGFTDSVIGSGFLISGKDGKYYVVTANHLALSDNNFEIVIPGQERPFGFTVVKPIIANNPSQVDAKIFPVETQESYITANLSTRLEKDQKILVSGFPLDPNKKSAIKHVCQSITEPVTVSGVSKVLKFKPVINKEENLPENGMSGGNILDSLGQTVGIYRGPSEIKGENQFLGTPTSVILNAFNKYLEASKPINGGSVNKPEDTPRIPSVNGSLCAKDGCTTVDGYTTINGCTTVYSGTCNTNQVFQPLRYFGK